MKSRCCVGTFRARHACAAALLVLALPVVAQDSMLEAGRRALFQPGNEVQLIVENDRWSGTDRYYTNGIKLGLGAPHGVLAELFRLPAEETLRRLSGSDAEIQFGLFAGQNLYTPRSIVVAGPQPNDRPWAAWLYLGGVAQRAEARRLDTAEIDIGMIGPAALGRQVQTAWHQIVDAPRPLGWSNQLPNEPAFVGSYVHKRKVGSGAIELIPHVGGSLGSVMTLARFGGMVRFGRNMTGFGPDGIEPGGATLQNTRRMQEAASREGFELYAFVGVDWRLVARNAFLDGTLLRDSPGVERRGFVHDRVAGVVFRQGHFRLSITRILRSEEFTGPAGGGGKQGFHSVSLGWEF